MTGKITQQKAKRGRPAQLSRAQILECALKLLEQGTAKVTISGVARALNTAPMSLYSHVNNRDDLLMGVSDLVLSQLSIDLDDKLSWQQLVRSWMFQVHDQLADYPQVVKLIGEARSLPSHWLRIHVVLLRCLDKAGLKGETLSLVSSWLAQIIISDLLLNSSNNPQAEEQSVLAAMEQLSDQDKASMALIVPYLSNSNPQSLFEFVVDQAIGRLEFLAAQA